MDASVVVPSYRGADHLPTLLDALRRQDHEGPWEVVVVLDGVEDESPAVLERYSDLPLRTVVFDENRGRAAALNAGFQAAHGWVLIRCDDDLEPNPDYVRLHVEAHAGVDPVGIIGICRHVLPPTAFAEAYGNQTGSAFWDEALATQAGDAWRFWAGNCSATRESFDKVGDYDESFRRYGWEDIDWGYRLASSGVPIRIVEALETPHHAASITTEIRAVRAYQSGEARRRFDLKHHITPPSRTAPGLGAKVWNTAVSAVACKASQRRFERLGRLCDSVVPRLPRPIGTKLIALTVESAGVGGYRRSTRVLG